MIEAVLPFVIFITNPVGSPASLGYPVSVYQQYVEKGERLPREYASRGKCEQRLREVQKQTYEALQNNQVMPEYRNVMTERMGSLRCLPADARPEARMRGSVPPQDARWRIGRLDVNGFFQGQNRELRHFNDEASCESAYEQMLRNYAGDATMLKQLYRCLPVAIKPPPFVRLY